MWWPIGNTSKWKNSQGPKQHLITIYIELKSHQNSRTYFNEVVYTDRLNSKIVRKLLNILNESLSDEHELVITFRV